MKVKFIKTGKLWDVYGERAKQLALDTNYEIVSMTPEEEQIIEITKSERPKTDEELFLGE